METIARTLIFSMRFFEDAEFTARGCGGHLRGRTRSARFKVEMFEHMNIRLVAWLCLALLPFSICAQANDDQPAITRTDIRGSVPAQSAHIVKYYIEALASGSGDETGNLHIVYSDKTEVSDTLRPKRQITDESNHVVYNMSSKVSSTLKWRRTNEPSAGPRPSITPLRRMRFHTVWQFTIPVRP